MSRKSGKHLHVTFGNIAHVYTCPLVYNNYADAYFQSDSGDVALDVTESPVKRTNVT